MDVNFGVDAYLTNDMELKTLNIALKLVEVDGLPVAKLRDSISKIMCQSEVFIGQLKDTFYYQQAS